MSRESSGVGAWQRQQFLTAAWLRDGVAHQRGIAALFGMWTLRNAARGGGGGDVANASLPL